MKRDRTLLLCALILLAAGGLWLAFGGLETPTPLTDDRTGGEPAAADAADSRVQPKDAPSSPVAVREELPATPPTMAGPDSLMLRGRCIDDLTRDPLPNVQVTLYIDRGLEGADQGNGSGNPSSELPDEPPVATLTTAADGRFEFAQAFDAWQDTLIIHIAARGFVTRMGRWSRPTPGDSIDVGDVPLRHSIAVQGRVVDRENAPVADVAVMFVYLELEGGHELKAEHFLRATSDAEGRFTFTNPAFPGEWWIGAELTGPLVEPRSVKLGPELTDYELRVVVERPDPRFDIEGTVVDWQNRPLAGARLSVSGEGFIGRGRSGADGRFTIRRAGPIPDNGKPGTRLSCSLPGGLHHRVRPTGEDRIPWGADGVEVVMRRLAQRNVRVIDGAGQPVESYALFVLRGKERRQVYRSLLRRGRHPDGRCSLDGLHGGPHVLLVAPRDPALATTGLVPFEVDLDAPATEITVELGAPVPTTVHVATVAGTALADSQIELLLDLGAKSATPTSRAVPLADADRSLRSAEHVIVASATTDSDGNAHFAAPPGRWTVRASSEQHLTVVKPLVVRAPAASLHLTVAAAASIRGRLTPPTALATFRELAKDGEEPLAVIVTPDGGEPRPPALVDDTGSFRIGGLAAGSYTVAFRHWLRTSEAQARSVTQPATTAELGPGEARELTIDLSTMLPGTVHGRVVAGGEPLRDVHCFLRPRGSRLMGQRVGTDVNGHYSGLVPPADYGFSITYPAQPGPGWVVIRLPDEWTLRPGETREQNFDLPLRRVRVRITDGADLPVADLQVRVVAKGYFQPGGLTTNASGLVEIFPAPLEAFRLRAEINGEKVELGPVDLPAGITTGEVTVKVPD
ncbi:MAG: hypothetical protein NXI31_14940 [bacterium]|nr:hypothetical protein [bacterium]